DAVLAEVRSETGEADERRQAAPNPTHAPVGQQRDLGQPSITRGETRGFAVVLAGPVGAAPTGAGATYTPWLDRDSVPDSLVRHFATSSSIAWTYPELTRLAALVEAVSSEPGVVVGSQVRLPADGETYT
ncbi:two-component sensor histidine kinase, partial [Nocardioides sp. P86]|nr:two-component sensor histidine kinase [Nocardioides sp. P86]